MHTSIGAKLFIGILDYCLKVDEPVLLKMGFVCLFALNFQCEESHTNIVRRDFLLLVALK